MSTQLLAPNTQPSGLYPAIFGPKKKKEEQKMPLPTPNPGESQDSFISRFMSSDAMQKEFSDQKQRLAVAYSQWRGKKEEAYPSGVNSEPLIDAFNRWYQEVFGKGKFSDRTGCEGYLKKEETPLAPGKVKIEANFEAIKKEIEEAFKAKDVVEDKDTITAFGPGKKLAPYWPDEGSDQLHNMPRVHVYEEKPPNELLTKVCEEVKTEYNKMLKKQEDMSKGKRDY